VSFPWRSLFQSVQDDLEGLGDAVFGDRAERLLDGEIRNVDQLLHRTRGEHATARARRIDAQQSAQRTKLALREAETTVESLLARRRTGAAREAAGEVVRLQAQLAELQADAAEMELHEARFAQLQSQLKHRLRRLKHQLDTHRATASLQRAQAAVARRQPGDAPYPEPAPASAQRMRRAGRAAAGDIPVGAPPPVAMAALSDPVDGVIERIGRRIKQRSRTTTPPRSEQARRR